MYETTYPENTASLKNVYNYMYSTNLKNEIYENIGTKSVQPVYDVNKGIMRGFTLLYSARTGNTACTLKQLENLDRLYDIKQLQYDWNGNGSKPISEKVLSFSKIIINGILVQPQIYPTGRATVQMQYELKDRSYLEFEVFEDKIVCMKVPQRIYTKASIKIIKTMDMDIINDIVKEFYGKQNTKA